MHTNIDYSEPFSEYLDNMNTNGVKFAIAITKKQYVFFSGGIAHEYMVRDLIRETRPDIEIDGWGNALNRDESYDKDNVVLLGYPFYMLVNLPQEGMLSEGQFDRLERVLLDIKDYNERHERKFMIEVCGGKKIDVEYDGHYKDIDGLIDKLRGFVQEYDVDNSNEVIIGEPIGAYSK